MKRRRIQAADLFCGAGGTSTGLAMAARILGVDVTLVAVNHWPVAIATHQANHPDHLHKCANLAQVDPCELVPGGYLDALFASPECTHHSIARGGKPRSDQSRSSSRFADAAEPGQRWIPARDIIDWSLPGRDIAMRKKPLAKKTLRRIEIGIREFCIDDPQPFLIVLRGTGTARSVDRPLPAITAGGGHLALVTFLVQYYGSSDIASVDAPLPTVTTKDRFALITLDGRSMQIRLRMLTKRELARAQGFGDGYVFAGNGTEVGKQIGNAVPPPVAQALALEVLSA